MRMRLSWGALWKFGARGQLHLEGRALADRRLDPDATTVHLYNLLGDGEAEAGPALRLGIGVVNLMKLVEDPVQLLRRYTRTRISHGNSEVAVHGRRGDAHL